VFINLFLKKWNIRLCFNVLILILTYLFISNVALNIVFPFTFIAELKCVSGQMM